MQKLDQIQKYAILEEGTDATFVHPEGQADQARKIKMRINAPGDVNLFITPVDWDYETGTVTTHYPDAQIFLAHVNAGFESLDFMYQGSFCLNAIGSDIWLDTYDNSAFSVEASDPTSFARLFEREERHPAILEMERMARHNQEALRLQNAAEMAAAIAALEKRMTANVVTPASASTSAAPSGEGGAGAPVSTSAPAANQEPGAAAPNGASGNSA